MNLTRLNKRLSDERRNKMIYCVDTEFIEIGNTIELISIDVVGIDGSEYYAVCDEYNENNASDWVRQNVLSYLPKNIEKKSMSTIRCDLEKFLDDLNPVLDGLKEIRNARENIEKPDGDPGSIIRTLP